jgi:transposase-like protein
MARKQYSKVVKAQVALDAIKGQKTVAEISSEYGVHASQIGGWKKQLLDNAAELFSRAKGSNERKQAAERDTLYQKVGQLQVEVDWLKKVGGSLR